MELALVDILAGKLAQNSTILGLNKISTEGHFWPFLAFFGYLKPVGSRTSEAHIGRFLA